jgi:WD40 repeat protein
LTKKAHRPVFNPYSALIRSLEGHTSNVVKVGINGEGNKAVSAAGDNSVKYWDLITGECLKTFSGHLDFVNCACVSH